MKPVAFDFFAPGHIDEALALLHEHGDEARVLAGGQSLIPLLNFRLAQPSVIVDINRIPELSGVSVREGSLWIRATTRESALEELPAIGRGWPLLLEAAAHIGHAAIRNRGTIGGSAAHADPTGELPATLTALNARFHARSAGGMRTLAADDFFAGALQSALASDELLTDIEIPPMPERTGSAFVEFARRHGDFALAGSAVHVTLAANGTCESASIVLLGAGDTPRRCLAAQRALRGHVIDAATALDAARVAARVAARESDPPDPVDFRRALIEECVERALMRAAERVISP